MRNKRYKLSPYIEKSFETEGRYAEWGGYYNYDFLSSDGSKLLCNRCSFDGRAVEHQDTVDVGYYDIPSGEWHYLDSSDSFNWPQATMLQWVPCTNNKQVIFNLSKDGHLISRIINIETGEKRDLCYPIYCLTPDGKKAITLNFERSYWTPAYHYQSVVNEACNVDVLEGDGIFALDLEKNTLERIISLDNVINIKPDADFDKGKHWLEHIMINPSGNEMVFLHRYKLPGTGRLTRMVMANINGSNLQVIDGWQKYAWSHFGWKTDDSFVMFARTASKLTKAYGMSMASAGENTKKTSLSVKIKGVLRACYRKTLSPLIPKNFKARLTNDSGYQMYEKIQEQYKLKHEYKGKLLDIDGHPSFTSDGKYMITDSYADDKKYRRLLVFNTENEKKLLLGKFYSPFWGTPASCDLHPKISADKQHLVIDTAYSGTHRMMVVDLKWNKIKEVIG